MQKDSNEEFKAFLLEKSAWDFADALKGKKVKVHYNPGKPSTSTLQKAELERLLPAKKRQRPERLTTNNPHRVSPRTISPHPGHPANNSSLTPAS
jgi:hypothetical protein